MVARVGLFALAALVTSCGNGRSNASSVILPPTSVVTLRPTWAVVTEPYIRLRAEPRRDAPIEGHLRRGDVAEIEAISTVVELVEDERHFWYRLTVGGTSGWVLDSAVESYGSEDRARSVSARMGERG